MTVQNTNTARLTTTGRAGRPTITARAIALLDETAGRRLRIRYRTHPEIYAELLAVHELALRWRVAGVDATQMAVSDPSERALTTGELADAAGITPNGVREAIRAGRLRAVRRAGRWWIPAGEAGRWLRQREEGTRAARHETDHRDSAEVRAAG